MGDIDWNTAHFWKIVNEQALSEAVSITAAANTAPGPLGPWLVCDTDTLATVAWWERYLNQPSDALFAFAMSRLADMYVVTSPEGIPFDSSDPLRDGEAIRGQMHLRMLELARLSGRPLLTVSGDRATRLATTVKALEEYEASNPRFVHQ